MRREIRIKIKLMLGFVGLVILIGIIGHEWQKLKPQPEKEYQIEDQWIKNVYVIAAQDGEVRYFADGAEHTLKTDLGKKEDAEKVADIHIVRDQVEEIRVKNQAVSGKLTRVGADELEIEGQGIFPFAPDMKVYRIYGGLEEYAASDLTIGYNDADFIVEDGKISACLIVRNETMKYVRVLLKTNHFADIYHPEITLQGMSDFEVVYGETREEYKAGETVSFTADSAYAEEHKIYVTPKSLTGKMQVTSLTRSQGTPAYRGTLEIMPQEQGFLIVNEVLLEEYLYAVLPSEMPDTYEPEALKAQAVCARSYAYKQIEASQCAEYGAHIDDSTSYQVYNNCEEKPGTTAAVRDTAGLVVKQDGEVMDAYYFSTSCGFTTDYKALDYGETEGSGYLDGAYVGERGVKTEKTSLGDASEDASDDAELMASEDVFREYIKSADYSAFESNEPWFRWTMELRLKDLTDAETRIRERRARAPNQILVQRDGEFVSGSFQELGEIKALRVLKRSSGGVIEELLVEGTEASVKVIGEYNVRYVLAVPGSEVRKQNQETAPITTLLPSAYFVMEYFEGDGDPGYRLYGGGYGHGVGMSQNGANNMAKKGMDSEAILKYFYRESQIGEMYEGLDHTAL